MLVYSHCERPSGAWQSHLIKTGLVRHSIPHNDTALNTFLLDEKYFPLASFIPESEYD